MSVLRSGNAIKGIDQMKCCFESHFVLPLIIVHCFQFSFTVSQDHPKEELQHEQVEWEWCSIMIKHQKKKSTEICYTKALQLKGCCRIMWHAAMLKADRSKRGNTTEKKGGETEKNQSRGEEGEAQEWPATSLPLWPYVIRSFLLSLQGANFGLGLGMATSVAYEVSSNMSWKGSRSSDCKKKINQERGKRSKWKV